jgi:hypothetical protein
MLKKYKEEWDKIIEILKGYHIMGDLQNTRENFLCRVSIELSEEDLGLIEIYVEK